MHTGNAQAPTGRGDTGRSFAYPWYEQNRRWLLDWAAGSRTALEFGCGVGWMTATLAGAGIDTLGIDLSAPKIEHARRHHPGVRFEVLEMGPTTFPPGSFDFVVSNQVLEHVPDVDAVLAMLHAVIRPGGRAFFSVPNGYGLYCLLYDKLAVALGRQSEHEQFHSLSQWRDRFARHGFRTVDVLSQNVLPYRLFPPRLQGAAGPFIHRLNLGLCAITPKSWASAFYFRLERLDVADWNANPRTGAERDERWKS